MTAGRVAVGIALLGALLIGSVASSARAASRRTDDDVREAVLRYQKERHPSPVYFLSVHGHNPSRAFMRRFHGTAQVKPRSASSTRSFYVTDPRTHQRGTRCGRTRSTGPEGRERTWRQVGKTPGGAAGWAGAT